MNIFATNRLIYAFDGDLSRASRYQSSNQTIPLRPQPVSQKPAQHYGAEVVLRRNTTDIDASLAAISASSKKIEALCKQQKQRVSDLGLPPVVVTREPIKTMPASVSGKAKNLPLPKPFGEWVQFCNEDFDEEGKLKNASFLHAFRKKYEY